ncbi:alpha-N-arabinofuranosidase [Vigna unguiculata]|uniref:Alpha-N-arabinofuranosidase n=1 Tax=Vigna unguiculata TaxID=3917 RepID=A0A4D6L321_VIGUN|nr:alpha-N-arabinofuranosidase [Vigna unguiculata]
MVSYAPLFVNANDKRWTPDAVVFDSHQRYGTLSYWIQHLFSTSSGATLLYSTLEIVASTIEYRNPVDKSNDIFSAFSASFTISGQPSSSPTTSATVPHSSHRPAHLRRTDPTIPHTSDALEQHFVAAVADPRRRSCEVCPRSSLSDLFNRDDLRKSRSRKHASDGHGHDDAIGVAKGEGRVCRRKQWRRTAQPWPRTVEGFSV